jgi:coiled-coil domain-containing protein 130
MGRYVPPELEGTTSGNKLAGKHALGARANKIGQGILTVRFEMPFAIWCTTCKPRPKIIGQGVRFNAEKKKIGNYFSTPIYSFRMKHIECGGWIQINTDPKNTAYVVVEGAAKRDTGDEKAENDPETWLPKVKTDEERERLDNDAFARTEAKVEDKIQASTSGRRIEELMKWREKDWSDPYENSRKLRKGFRAERKIRQGNEKASEELKDRMGLGIDLLDENEDDRRRAQYVDFDRTDPDKAILKAKSKPLFEIEASSEVVAKSSKTQKIRLTREEKRLKEADETRRKLQIDLKANTRAVMDPFLFDGREANSSMTTSRFIPGIKRKRADDLHEAAKKSTNLLSDGIEQESSPQQKPVLTNLSLVDYDSD